ncbi:hypothetical protein [Streptomyces roseochromogenus]|uniref:Uncharacterized protein n=1 Tax=Streptomyces roseochromogenus subsp. oscitans DS 12.976 TaxID=1352936 RepID=V6JDD2_STRRC|nr:hypothetical protein [Streptomyces roseochromogenus]EST17927.1 hypothetical protein M878_46235 [Streptomyces roseochromogenus subsp. oscitans DS 12.976]
MDLSFNGPYYAAAVLSLTTAAALLISAVSGHRHGNPAGGVPMLLLGLFVAEGPALYGALVDGDPDADLTGSMLGGLAGVGIGTVVGLAIVVSLTTRWSRRSER